MGYQPTGKKIQDVIPSNIGVTVDTNFFQHTIVADKSTGINFSEDAWNDIFQEMSRRFNQVPTIEHKCHNCGGRLELHMNQHIFNCPYCDSVYAIGTQQIYSQ